MTNITGTKSRHRWPPGLAAGIVLAATLTIGAFPGSADAEWRRDDRRDDRRGDRRDERRDYHHRDWNSGYYRAPPVVYGSPYYAPPVVYGNPFGLNINIR
jgi:hypothetical protein